jgi:menaquinone-dependent protoporphyrinogen oxidase
MKPSRGISRRGVIKVGCVGTAAAGLTVCGVSLAAPEPPPIELEAHTYGEEHEQRILIAYASATGSTAEIASELGKTISQARFRTEVKPIREQPALDGYKAVILGSAVQHGKWLPEAIEFVKTNRQSLQRNPVVLFTVHIQNLGDDEASRRNRRAYLDEIRPLLQPVDEAFFAGRFDRRGAQRMLPGWLARFVPTIDLRDWEKIQAWALSIYPLLNPSLTSSS